MRSTSSIVALALAALTAACASSNTLTSNKDVVQRFTATINAANWDGLDDLLTEDFRRHSQATADVEVRSREEFKALQESFRATFPDQHIALSTLVAEGDHVAALAVYSGTQSGPMGPFPATGRSIESHFLSIFRLEHGRIAELWVEFDNLVILTQLGLFPPPAVESP